MESRASTSEGGAGRMTMRRVDSARSGEDMKARVDGGVGMGVGGVNIDERGVSGECVARGGGDDDVRARKRERKTRRRAERAERGGAGDAGEEDWEIREKRRSKSKHGKNRRDDDADDAKRLRVEHGCDVGGGSKSTTSDASEEADETPQNDETGDMDSARASPVLDQVDQDKQGDEKVHVPSMVGPIVVVGWAEEQGQRSYMEDRFVAMTNYKPLDECDGVRRSFLGVYDGHNGDWAAQYCSESMHKYLNREIFTEDSAPECPDAKSKYDENMTAALKRMYLECDDHILDATFSEGRRDGCTAVNILQVGKVLFAAHAGDSRAVIVYADGRARAMTEDHKPSSATERRRITAVGGKIEFCGCWRVVADHPFKPVRAALAVSRSLGDIDFKRPKDAGVTAEPDVKRFELNKNVNFLIIASDGLWDVIRDQEAGDIARNTLTSFGVFKDGKCVLTDIKSIEVACHAAAKELLDTSLNRGTSDNVTAIVAVYVH
uniref:PPM-type phosphatase domain-containing protein n=1 Tax=Ostreococcus mediterraneus TaxID=1486918 RepID=A0A6T5SZ91_9CHLO|mmetsp:Transcript_239/g.990  ORF Transcript_239/g.990 Transcript_239/m.990 type:complete len:492 (+) Transcript_239:211-1686(+)